MYSLELLVILRGYVLTKEHNLSLYRQFRQFSLSRHPIRLLMYSQAGSRVSTLGVSLLRFFYFLQSY